MFLVDLYCESLSVGIVREHKLCMEMDVFCVKDIPEIFEQLGVLLEPLCCTECTACDMSGDVLAFSLVICFCLRQAFRWNGIVWHLSYF